MSEKLLARRLSIVTTVKCTLKCKLCCNLIPMFESPYDVPLQNILKDIDHVFEIFDYIEWLQFVGGEIFMHRDMKAVYEHVLKYSDRYDKMLLFTNATIIPKDEEIAVLKRFGKKCKIVISDYGIHSKIKEILELCQMSGIPYDIKSYHGENQHCGGWIDNSSFIEFSGSDQLLLNEFITCPHVKMNNMTCLNGKLHLCSNSCFMSELGVIKSDKKEYVDLNDSNMCLQEKRSIIQSFYRNPISACRICSFKNADTAKRFPAAEQIK